MDTHDLEWYCDSCNWHGDFKDTLYCNDPCAHPQCPKCTADDSVFCKTKIHNTGKRKPSSYLLKEDNEN
jgi:hypothetical protein